MGANSFHYELTPIYMGGNNENDRFTSTGSVAIHLKQEQKSNKPPIKAPIINLRAAYTIQVPANALQNHIVTSMACSINRIFLLPNRSASCPVNTAPHRTPAICIDVIVPAKLSLSQIRFHCKYRGRG